MAAKAAVHGAPQKAFSRNASDENERWRWTEEVYQRKNNDEEKNNNYDWNRRELNFEINKGKIEKLGSNGLRLHERLQQKLDELKFKTYKDDAQNKPNCCVDWVFSGDHDRMCEMAFGKSYRDIDYSLKSDNTEAIKKTDAYKFLHPEGKKKPRQPEIYKWAMEVYKFACRKWGEENIIGMEVHLDETTPHAHVLMVPVAERKSRGRVSTKYERKGNPSMTIKKQEYELLPEEEKQNYQPVSKKSQRSISYSGVFGDNYPERKEYMKQFHTDFYEQVGKHFGLERGDDLDLLDPEERRKRRHLRKDQLHAVQEHERKVAELSSSIASLQEQNGNLMAEQTKLTERINALPSEEELETLENRSKVLKDEIASREKRLKDLPSLESIIERENRHKSVPSLDDITKREKKFKSDKQQLVKLLSAVREELEEQKDYSSLGELNKLGNIKNDVEWFNAASMLLNRRNQKLLEEEAKLRRKVKTANDKILILTDSINSLKKEGSRINKNKKAMYQSSVLPVVDGGIEVSIEKSQEGGMCVFARVGEEWLGKKLAEEVLADYNSGIATKEQIAAIFLSGEIIDTLKKKGSRDIEALRHKLYVEKREMYGSLILPQIDQTISISIDDVGEGGKGIFASIGGDVPRGYILTQEQINDLEGKVATKEQMAARLMTGDIINYIKEQKEEELDGIERKIDQKKSEFGNIHVPTQAEIESARRELTDARRDAYSKFELPKIDADIKITIERSKQGNMCVFPIIDGEYMNGTRLTEEQLADINNGLATKEQMAAFLVSEKILKYVTEKRAKQLESLNEKIKAANEKGRNAILTERAMSIFGDFGNGIKNTISILQKWTGTMRPQPTSQELMSIHNTIEFMAAIGEAGNRNEAAEKLCDIAIPIGEDRGGRWHSDVVDIVKAVAEQGPQIDLRRGRGRGIR